MLAKGSYTIEPIGSLLEEWKYNDITLVEKVTNEWNLKGLKFSQEMIEYIKDFDVTKKIPTKYLDKYLDINVNYELEHKGYDKGDYTIPFTKWKEEKLYYVSQINASKTKVTKDSYFIGYTLLTRMVLARLIYRNDFTVDTCNKTEAIKILTSLH